MVRRVVVGALAGAVVALLGAGPAAAGGPTSVLLSLPGTGRMTALHVGSADYEALAEHVGANGGVVATAGEGTAGRHDRGPVLTLTWLIHDIQPWRIDYVYPTAPGGPWISTLAATDSGNVGAATPVWHRAADPAGFRALIARLGVDPTDWSPSDGGVAPQGKPADSDPLGLPPASSAAPAAAGSGSAAASSGGSAPAGWVWGVVGLMAGAALTVAGEQAWARRRRAAAPPAPVPAPAADGDPPPVELELDPVVVRR